MKRIYKFINYIYISYRKCLYSSVCCGVLLLFFTILVLFKGYKLEHSKSNIVYYYDNKTNTKYIIVNNNTDFFNKISSVVVKSGEKNEKNRK